MQRILVRACGSDLLPSGVALQRLSTRKSLSCCQELSIPARHATLGLQPLSGAVELRAHLAGFGVDAEGRLQQVVHLLGHLDIQPRVRVRHHDALGRRSQRVLQPLILRLLRFLRLQSRYQYLRPSEIWKEGTWAP